MSVSVCINVVCSYLSPLFLSCSDRIWLQGVITQVMTMEEHTANMNAQPSYGEYMCGYVFVYVGMFMCMFMCVYVFNV